MGIQNFQPFIKKVYAKACNKYWMGVEYDNLYIDLNHVLHHVCYLSTSKEDLLNRCKDYLRGIIVSLAPTKRVILVADGPAPLAKMVLQRKRRLDSVKQLDGDIDLEKNLNLNLTPGTEFMMNLGKSLEGFINYVKERHDVEVIALITDADEGEIKIRHYLQKLERKFPDETHIVYSGDSDMILLLFTCEDLENVYQALSKDVIIHYGTLYKIHVKEYGETDTAKLDFVFVNLMMGNDYLPKVSFLKIENLWNAYKIVAQGRQCGLVKCDKSIMSVDSIFLHDLLYIATKKTPPHLLRKFKLSDIADGSYQGYVNGLYWCFGMYTTGNCSNYKYIYEYRSSPHINGVILTVMSNDTYKILHTKAIDSDLYGILLIPEKAKKLLSKEQNLIAEQLASIHPIIYEEGRCKICKKTSKIMSKLNIEYKKFRPKSKSKSKSKSKFKSKSKSKFSVENTDAESEVDELPTDDNISEADNPENTEKKKELSKKIAKMNKKISAHKETHEKLSITQIEEIAQSFSKIRTDVRETLSQEKNDSDNEGHIEKYVPNARKLNIMKKKLF
jgi:hypothetical protein